MQVNKESLKKEAFALALIELKGRILYRDYLNSANSITQADLGAIQEQWEEQKKVVNALQAEIPECAEKHYWWDVPYNVDLLPKIPVDYLSMPQGTYSEQLNFDEYNSALLPSKEQVSAEMVLSIYMRFSDYVVLYADRKKLKSDLFAPVDVRAILCCEEFTPKVQRSTISHTTMVKDPTNSSEYQFMQQEIDSIRRGLEYDIAEFERKSDNFERILNAYTNQGPFTDKENWMMGQMDSDSYYATELYRSYRESEIRAKARDEISRLEYKMQQMRAKANFAYTAQMQNAIQQSHASRRDGMRMLRCGYTFYMNNTLVGIVLFNRDDKLWEFSSFNDDPCNLYDIYDDSCHDAQEKGWAHPDPIATMEFILERFGSKIKPYSVLASRPKNASDELWRCWAEMRFANLISRSE